MALINATGSNDKNSFLSALFSAMSDFYIKNSQTTLGQLFSKLAEQLTEVDTEISALLHDNFLSVEVQEEILTRGEDAKDKLLREGAFAIDRVGFTSRGVLKEETHTIEDSTTIVTLDSVPEDYMDIRIMAQSNDNPISTVIEYDEDANTITVTGVDEPGTYRFRYADKGVTKKETERLTISTELFQTGWGQGGFGNFGFGQ